MSGHAIVLGAGPVGQHTAAGLLDLGMTVEVLHADPFLTRTATNVGPAAAGLVEPVATAPEDSGLVNEILGDCLATWLERVADRDLGVDRRIVRFRPAGAEPPDWVRDTMGGAPTGDGTWTFASVVVTPSLFLPENARRLAARGAVFRVRRVRFLADLCGAADVVVNATGPGAWSLGDSRMTGLRGAMAWVSVRGAEEVRFDDSAFLYGIPQRHRLALGGTRQPVHGDPTRWSRTPDDEEVARLLRAGRRLYPDADWRHSDLLEATVDYRPARDRLRLEVDHLAGFPVVHATGMGGSGWTLAPAVGLRAARLAHTAATRANRRTA